MVKSEVLILGAGIAGASLAHACCRYGVAHWLLETTPQAAAAASGNRLGALFPNIQAEFSPFSQFFYQAYCYAQDFYQSFPESIEQHWPGLWQWAFDARQEKRQEKIKAYLPQLKQVSWHSAAESSEQLGFAVPFSGLLWAKGGFIAPKTAVARLLRQSPTVFSVLIKNIQYKQEYWQVTTPEEMYQAKHLLLATGAGVLALKDFLPAVVALPWQVYRGQLTYLALQEALSWPQPVLCFHGYALLASPWELIVGSTYQPTPDFPQLRAEDQQKNLEAAAFLPWLKKVNYQSMSGRVAYRLTTKDRLPVIGALAPGLWVSLGHGSRGLLTAPLAAEQLLAEICQSPRPLSPAQGALLSAQRFFKEGF